MPPSVGPSRQRCVTPSALSGPLEPWDRKLHAANLRLSAPDSVNLNDETVAAPYAEAFKVLASFGVYAGTGVSL